MMSATEIKNRRDRYEKLSAVSDDMGRVIKFRPLKPSELTKIREWAPALDGTDKAVDADTGQSVEVPKNLNLILAASVREIDDGIFMFPRNRAELDSVLDLLDDEGIVAIMKGMMKLGAEREKQAAEVGADAAKNSSETPAS